MQTEKQRKQDQKIIQCNQVKRDYGKKLPQVTIIPVFCGNSSNQNNGWQFQLTHHNFTFSFGPFISPKIAEEVQQFFRQEFFHLDLKGITNFKFLNVMNSFKENVGTKISKTYSKFTIKEERLFSLLR